MALTLMKGSEAIAEAAIRAGARFFFGYPITPQTEIPEYMSARMPEIGGCFLQAESEVAAINMVYGAAGTGMRVITSSSSPGVSLKQEGISYIAGAQLPCVILNVMRGGPGLGNIQASQGDYFQATKGGGNGDYHLLTYAPSSIQEVVDTMMFAYEKAEKYRIPVLFLLDGIIAQMMEPVEMPEMVEYKPTKEAKPWAAMGWKPGDDPAKRAVINSMYISTEELTDHTNVLQACYREIEKNEVMSRTTAPRTPRSFSPPSAPSPASPAALWTSCVKRATRSACSVPSRCGPSPTTSSRRPSTSPRSRQCWTSRSTKARCSRTSTWPSAAPARSSSSATAAASSRPPKKSKPASSPC